ncbi:MULTISPECIES: glycoside hydrolase family 2 TIM barrel-domain containing protein [unclassified Microbulbifer]|uniref:glycoside hydrolase family 2 TIM barrel-domain containing protein n=1 Tax=unclassified Microbulbifer TaxID=2619833 RepID=UPI0027E4A600|nr:MULTISPECIES: glycoside hydrolase family 2 TIM barrel-domain containing protein [unclassified Microbulbifer]
MYIDKSHHLCSVVALVIIAGFLAVVAPREAAAKERGLSDDWRFFKGDVSGAERTDFDDRKWKTVTVPHDWSIMDRAGTKSPFTPEAESGQDSGYLPGGTGWYRRQFILTEEEAAKNVRLNFGAVYMDADIWVNGRHLASHHYGYTAFTVDLTNKVRAGGNVVAVRARHEDPSSRWYAGSGIIQPVALEILNCVHIDPDSVFVTTPVATEKVGKVKVSAQVNHCGTDPRQALLSSRILDGSGAVVASTRAEKRRLSGKPSPWELSVSIENPSLWSLEKPNLYTLVQEVQVDGRVVDERRTRFGIRSITVDAKNGLRLNDRSIVLKGGNIHHDNYMIGAAGFPDADARKVLLMKQAGYNAIRNAHNPASKATLNAADELGMLVINEAFDSWNKHKRAKDYSRFFATDWKADIDSMVISGRNHPSVLFWSIGNEIPEQGTPLGVETAEALTERVRELDPTRPVTQAVSIDPPESAGQYAAIDVAGYNYRSHLFESDHTDYPDRVMYSSESLPKNAFKVWQTVEDMPWVIGDFVWTSVDYLGEAGIGWMGYSQDWQKLGPYPWHLAYCGEIDATGRKRPAAYYREVLWKSALNPISAFVQQPEGTADLPDRHYFKIEPPHLDWSLEDVHPSWTWPGQENKPLTVFVYSEHPEVELFLNGESLGRKAVGEASEYKATYTVPYQPGLLKAVGYNQEREAGSWVLRTAGSPAAAKVYADRHRLQANGLDLAYVSVELTDQNGTPIYARSDDRFVDIQVEGPAELIGVGNGNPMDASSFQSGRKKTFHGRVVAVVRAGTEPGQVTVRVAVEGQPEQQQVLHVTSVDYR